MFGYKLQIKATAVAKGTYWRIKHIYMLEHFRKIYTSMGTGLNLYLILPEQDPVPPRLGRAPIGDILCHYQIHFV